MAHSEKDQQPKRDPFDGEYIGNIWGWKTSFIGLFFILALLGLMIYRHWALGVPFGMEEGAERQQYPHQPPPPADTTATEDTLQWNQ